MYEALRLLREHVELGEREGQNTHRVSRLKEDRFKPDRPALLVGKLPGFAVRLDGIPRDVLNVDPECSCPVALLVVIRDHASVGGVGLREPRLPLHLLAARASFSFGAMVIQMPHDLIVFEATHTAKVATALVVDDSTSYFFMLEKHEALSFVRCG